MRMEIWFIFFLLLILSVLFGLFLMTFRRTKKKTFLSRSKDLNQVDYRFFKDDQSWFLSQSPQDLTMKGKDGHLRHAYYLAHENKLAPVVILLHGYTSSALGMSIFARIYAEKFGCSILSIDALAHGKSEGKMIGFGYMERMDVNAWINTLQSLYPYQTSILIHGLSMGAATALFAMTSQLHPDVKGVIADSGFTHLEPVFRRQVKEIYHLAPQPTLFLLNIFMKLGLGFSLKEASIYPNLTHINRPLLLIHGTGDMFVPYTLSKELYEAHPQNTTLWLVDHSAHACAIRDQRLEYIQRIKSFIQRIEL